MRRFVTRTIVALTALTFSTVGLMLAGCGGSGGGISTQVLSGNASVGAPLAGQVSLKDSSTPPQQKTTIIGSDGSFAFDVTGLKAPYILQGAGSAAGSSYKLHSFADGTGIANVNPLSNVMVAGAAGVNDPEQLYAAPDAPTLQKIKSALPATTSDLLTKLQPLLQMYSATGKDPIKDHYDADHQGLDGMFDNVKITIPNGVVTVTNSKTGAVIFTANVADIRNGQFSPDPASIPQLPALPAAPSGVSAVGGTGQMTLSWNAASDASYNLYYSTTPGVTTGSGTKIPNAATPYIQTALAAGTTYYYIVTAVNSAGEGNASAQFSATTTAAPAAPATPATPTTPTTPVTPTTPTTPVTPTTPATPAVPGTPAGVSATGGTKQVTLSWNAVSNAASYNVYYATTSGVTTANGTKIVNVVTPAVQAGLAEATTYYYIVTAVNSAGESAASVQVAATTLAAPAPTPVVPAAPVGLSGVGGANQVNLTWSTVSGANSYNLYWSATPGVTKTNGTKVVGITSPYVKTGLSAGSTYYFIVTASNSAGESVASAQATATTNAPVAKQLTLAWDQVSDATSYNLYWSTVPGVTPANGTKISGVSYPYVHTGLAAGTTYYYVVTAVDSAGESAASISATGTTSL